MAENDGNSPAVQTEKEKIEDKSKDIKINLNKEIVTKQQLVNKNNIDFSEIEEYLNKESIFI